MVNKSFINTYISVITFLIRTDLGLPGYGLAGSTLVRLLGSKKIMNKGFVH